MNKRITVNVGGTRYKLYENYLRKYPGTLLSNKDKGFYDAEKDEYFFDRDPEMFKYVYQFYVTGKLHCPYEFEFDCWALYRDEMEFFGIPISSAVSDCCVEDYLDQDSPENDDDDEKNDALKKHSWSVGSLGMRAKMREFMDDPQSSTCASAFHIFIGITIFVSVTSNVLETLPCTWNKTCAEEYSTAFFAIELLCIAIFTAEYIGGVFSASLLWKHIRDPLNIIDVMAILPFYFNIIFEQFVAGDQGNHLQGLSVLRIFRIFRILKFARYSHKLQDMFKSLKKSSSELSFILFSYFLTIVLFSSIVFYMEKKDDHTPFESILTAMWYTIVTTTTTG